MAGPIPTSWEVDPGAASAREVTAGLWRLRLPWSWEGIDHVNAYLLTDGEQHALVDCGPAGHPTCLAALERALEPTGVALEAIGRVLLTHGHSDHVGQVREIVRRSGAEVWLHPDTEHVDAVIADPGLVAARRMRRARAEGVPDDELPWFGDVREETDTIVEPVRADHALVEGGVVPSPLGPLEVIATPGHAPSLVALHQRERGLLFVSDTLCSVFSPYYDYGFSADPVGELLASLDRLEALGPVAHALPGHGRDLPDLPSAVAEYRAGVMGELADMRAAVAAGPAGAYELAQRAFGPLDTAFATFLRTTVAAGYLRHLRLRGETTRSTGSDGRLLHAAAPSPP